MTYALHDSVKIPVCFAVPWLALCDTLACTRETAWKQRAKLLFLGGNLFLGGKKLFMRDADFTYALNLGHTLLNGHFSEP